ncbi:hypothetical protein KO566_11390 [Flavobacteriaceae bacterium XHP0103]|uniref:hypothetical protein n=1 Tax=Marixanthotalea marina TaxID=2844359 RepID=UPI002989C979|nr:hypothetical protein [Marixanthotalea marina]MBU3822667.1 hypothetical protein [Marixanthotalea marina]
MKAKWCAIIFLFALLFAANQQQKALPNQEIVLQFTNDRVTTVEVQTTIEVVKAQLLEIGVDNLEVLEEENGTLKITYYSNTDADSVKKILSEAKDFKLGTVASNNREKEQPKKSSNKEGTFYSLNVFEIHKQDSGSGFGGQCAVIVKLDKNQFLNPFISVSETNICKFENNFKKSLGNSFYIAFALKNSSLKIPDGRAGPNC